MLVFIQNNVSRRQKGVLNFDQKITKQSSEQAYSSVTISSGYIIYYLYPMQMKHHHHHHHHHHFVGSKYFIIFNFNQCLVFSVYCHSCLRTQTSGLRSHAKNRRPKLRSNQAIIDNYILYISESRYTALNYFTLLLTSQLGTRVGDYSHCHYYCHCQSSQ